MPTPRNHNALIPSPPPEDLGTFTSTHNHPTCPVDEESRADTSADERDGTLSTSDATECTDIEATQQPSPPPEDEVTSDAQSSNACDSSPGKVLPMEDDGPCGESPHPPRRTTSPLEIDTSDNDQRHPMNSPMVGSHALQFQAGETSWPRTRFLPNSTTSFLRPGSCFKGTQQSDRQVYNVQVDIKHVDMSESYLCGYLRIQGLTHEHPTLTTFFEGEIIGTKYTFQTRHAEWGSNDKVDMQHWARFPAWRPLSKQAKRPDFSYRNFAQRDHIFMRWKEQFLVPDHRVKDINGASFEGFYYICFNQLTGHISGIYFHAKSERYQQLELNRVDDHGCLGAIEFR